MRFIAAHRPWLWGVEISLVLLLLGLLYVVRSSGEVLLGRWTFGVILLLFAVMGATHLLLMYEAWYRRGANGRLAALKKIVFIPLALVYTLAVLSIAVKFVVL